MRRAIDLYKEASDLGKIEVPPDTEGYPQSLDVLVDGVQLIGQAGKNIKFLRKIPIDPMTNSTDWGMRSYQDEPTSQSWGGQNVFDVFTKSDGVAFDGTNTKTGRRRGFTLLELMIVLTLIAVLVGIAIPIYKTLILRSRESTLKVNLHSLREVIDQYTADKKKAPQTLQDLVDAGYFREHAAGSNDGTTQHMDSGL